jgi:hypothetical protein
LDAEGSVVGANAAWDGLGVEARAALSAECVRAALAGAPEAFCQIRTVDRTRRLRVHAMRLSAKGPASVLVAVFDVSEWHAALAAFEAARARLRHLSRRAREESAR